MNKPILILMDDVHLEGRESSEHEDFSNEVNIKIQQIKDESNIPIVICAGDIGEGINGVQWASRFKCDVIYVCGNHEFWNHDFYNVTEDIKNHIKTQNLHNIKFLHNEEIILNGIRFIGSSLWTDLGNKFPWVKKNLMIKYHSAMRDFKKITADKWYEKDNEEKLRLFFKENNIDNQQAEDAIEKKLFNPLIQIQENNNSVDYISNKLKEIYDGTTIVVTHHLPSYELWMKNKKIPSSLILGDELNNEREFLSAIRLEGAIFREILMMGYYTNDLKHLCYNKFAPNYWLHGHLHKPIDECIGRTKIISSPVGYKKQSNKIKYKIIDIQKPKEFVSDYINNEIHNFDWKNLTETLRNLESIIKKFEIAINTGIFSAIDFQPILINFQETHANNLKLLKNQVNEWLKIFLYNNKFVEEKNIDDYYCNAKKSGITEMKFIIENNKNEGKYKFPDLINAQIDQNSFLNNINNHIGNTYYKDWLKDLLKIQIQISHYKLCLLNYCKEYK